MVSTLNGMQLMLYDTCDTRRGMSGSDDKQCILSSLCLLASFLHSMYIYMHMAYAWFLTKTLYDII